MKTSIADICDINPESIGNNNQLEYIRYIDISSVGTGVVNEEAIISPREAPSRAKRIVRANDTILSTVRPGRRSFYFFKDVKENTIVSTGFAVLRANEEITNPRYLYYLINLQSFTGYLVANENGAAYPAVTPPIIAKYTLNLPHISVQNKIGSILSQYDDLIENNLRRIELLEESARLLYREWFVHLRFPGHEHTKITKGVPEGWEKVTVSDLCESKQGFAFKGKDFLDDETDLTLVRMGNFKIGGGLQFADNTKYLPEGYGFNEKFKLQANDLVMVLSDVTRDGRIIGNVGFIPNDGKTYILNQRIAKIECNNKIRLFLYCHFNSQIFKDFCLGYATSATVLNLSNQNLYKHELLKPEKKILLVFNDFIEPIIKQIDSLTLTNTKLKQARDILLPRLMNGDIAV